MSDRLPSFGAFWPQYLSEHRHPVSRRLHFAGTTAFLAGCAASAVVNPVGFPLAMAGFGVLFAGGAARESRRRPLLHVAGMLGLPALASPVLFPASVAVAYVCAWTGHFAFERNRPATFDYPIWSLLGDLRMWGHMARGRLWRGNPLRELGLEPRPPRNA